MDTEPIRWSPDARHVRDMWQNAQENTNGFREGHLALGALIVWSRNYTINGSRLSIPGHIGIITAVEEDRVHYIHASPSLGLVEERQRKTNVNTMGFMAISSR